MSAPSIAERVAAGVAWLDEHRPGWVDHIDLARLDIGSGCDCILGQEFGHYFTAPISVLLFAAPALGFNVGFDDGNLGDAVDVLNAEWTRVIEERRAQTAGETS